MKKSAQAGIVHVGLIIGLVILGVAGYSIYQNSPDIFNGTEAASNRGTFSSLSAILKSDSATFNFSYSGSTGSYRVDTSTSSSMKQSLYRNFGAGSYSPIIVSNPQSKWSDYQCSKTIYWVISTNNGKVKSPVQTAVVDCSSGIGTTEPVSTPAPTFTPTPSPTGIGSTSPGPSPTPSSSCTDPQTKPQTVTVEGVDGTWCYDPDGSGGLTTASYCQDSCSNTADYCDPGTNIVRDGACAWSFDSTGINKIKVHCTSNGYDCVSRLGLTCSAGACQ